MPSRLHLHRLDTVARLLRDSGARSVLDLGCGSGALLVRLAREPQFERIVGLDSSAEALAQARKAVSACGALQPGRIALVQGSYIVADPSLAGFDAVVLVETIEHVDPDRLSSVERNVFAGMRPKTAIITTPNRDYNALLNKQDGHKRRRDHKFEWSRDKFQSWATGVGARNGYRARFGGIGEAHPVHGSPTQMAVFSRLAVRIERD